MGRHLVWLAGAVLAAQPDTSWLVRQREYLSNTLVGLPTQHCALQEERARAGRSKIEQYRATTQFPRQTTPLLLAQLVPDVRADSARRTQAETAIRSALREFDAVARSQQWALNDVAGTLAWATAAEYAVWRGSEPLRGRALSVLREQMAWWLIHNEIFQGFTPEERAYFHEQLALSAYIVGARGDRDAARADLHEFFGQGPERLTLSAEGRLTSDTSDTTPDSVRNGPGRRLVSEYRGFRPGR